MKDVSGFLFKTMVLLCFCLAAIGLGGGVAPIAILAQVALGSLLLSRIKKQIFLEIALCILYLALEAILLKGETPGSGLLTLVPVVADTLVTLSFLTAHLKRLGGLRHQVAAVLALIAGGFAVIEMTGFDFDAPNHFALLSSIVTLGVAAALVGASMETLAETSNDYYRRTSILTTALAMIITIGLWLVSTRQESVRYNNLISDRVESIRSEAKSNLKELSNALVRYGRRVAYLGHRDEAFLEIDSASYLEQLPPLRRIGIVDTKLNVIWSYPKQSQAEVSHFNQGSEILRREAFEAAIKTSAPKLSHALKLRSGEIGFVLPIPMYKDSKLTGLVYGAIDAQKFFSKLFLAREVAVGPTRLVQTKTETTQDRLMTVGGSVTTDYSVMIHESNIAVYEQKSREPLSPDDRAFADLSQTITIEAGLARWEITVTPTRSFFTRNHSRVPDDILFGGLLVSILIGALVNKFAKSESRSRSYSEWRKAVINGAEYSIISTDVDGVVQTFNKQAEKMLLYSALDVIGKITTAAFHDPVESMHLASGLTDHLGQPVEGGIDAYLVRARLHGVADEYECTYIRKDSTRLPVRLSVAPLLSESGELKGYICIARDLTDRKQIEANLQLTLSRLERVIETTGAGIWERNYQSRQIEHVDARGRVIFGFAPDEEFDYDAVVKRIHPDDYRQLSVDIEVHIATKTPRFETAFRIYSPLTQSERWISSIGQVSKIDGLPAKLTSVINDVTEEVENRKKLEMALADAETATVAKSAFLANMSHEIRTPLNGVIGMAGLLVDTELSPDQRSYASVIYQSGNTLLRLINDILDFSKIEAGKMELEESVFDISTLVENQVDVLIAKAQQKDISLSTFISPSISKQLIGDSGRLSQILLNLVGNAVKFTSAGGVLVSVAPVARSENDRKMEWVRFEVRDTGLGVSNELAKRLFQPFVQADSTIAKKFGGTGLGLSISSRLVALMGGRIGVIGTPNIGSIFWFEVPLKTTEFGEKIENSGEAAIDSGSRALSKIASFNLQELAGKSALIIEDDQETQEVLALYLTHWQIKHVSLRSNASITPAHHDFVFFGSTLSESRRKVILDSLGDIVNAPNKTLFVAPFGKKLNTNLLFASGIDEILTKPLKRARLLEALTRAPRSLGEVGPPPAAQTVLLVGNAPGSQVSSLARASDTAQVSTTKANEKSKCRIIVADDNSINLIVARSILDALGYSATCVSNGQEVLDMLAQSEYDIILMDCQMPEMDGFESTRRIRESTNPSIRDIAIIALTANATGADSKKCLAVGMDDFLTKPIVAEDLDKKLKFWTSVDRLRVAA